MPRPAINLRSLTDVLKSAAEICVAVELLAASLAPLSCDSEPACAASPPAITQAAARPIAF